MKETVGAATRHSGTVSATTPSARVSSEVPALADAQSPDLSRATVSSIWSGPEWSVYIG